MRTTESRRRGWAPGWAARAPIALVLGFLIAAASLAGFADVAEDLAEPQAIALDHGVLAFFEARRTPAATDAMRALSILGDARFILPLATIVAILLARRRQWAEAGIFVILVAGAALLNVELKHLFHRARPPGATYAAYGYSFPSWHAMVSLCVYGYLAHLVLETEWPTPQRAAAAAGLALLVLAIGASRLYLGVHWATDVIAGYLVALAWLTASVLAAGYARQRARRATNP